MKRCRLLSTRLTVLLLLHLVSAASGQVALVDDILLITQGQRKQDDLRTNEHLAPRNRSRPGEE